MGNGINGQIPKNWNPQKIINNWRNFCTSILPFDSIMAFTLWQGGPPIFDRNLWMNGGNSIWNKGQPWGTASTWGTWDSFIPSTRSSSAASTTQTTSETQEEKDKAEAKRVQLNKKFEVLKNILQDYASTLDEMNDSEGTLKVKINRLIGNSITQENYDKLVEVFKENNIGEKLKTDILNSMLPSENSSFKKKISKDCWTKKEWTAQIRITKDNVLEYMATFNALAKGNLVGTLLNRTNDKDAEGNKTNNRDKIVEHLNDMQKSLIELAEDICNNSKVSDETKQSLEQAVNKLKPAKVDEALCKANYKNYQAKLANLFNLTRIANLEKFEKEHEFLGLTFSEEEKKKLEDSKI